MKLLPALLGLIAYIAINRVDTRLFNNSSIKIFCQGLGCGKIKKQFWWSWRDLHPLLLASTQGIYYIILQPHKHQNRKFIIA